MERLINPKIDLHLYNAEIQEDAEDEEKHVVILEVPCAE